MDRRRFRVAVGIALAGGAAYAWAYLAASNPLYATAVGLVGVALLVALTDPVMRGDALAATGLLVAIASAFADAALTASGRSGALTALTTVALVAGAGVAIVARRSRTANGSVARR